MRPSGPCQRGLRAGPGVPDKHSLRRASTVLSGRVDSPETAFFRLFSGFLCSHRGGLRTFDSPPLPPRFTYKGFPKKELCEAKSAIVSASTSRLADL